MTNESVLARQSSLSLRVSFSYTTWLLLHLYQLWTSLLYYIYSASPPSSSSSSTSSSLSSSSAAAAAAPSSSYRTFIPRLGIVQELRTSVYNGLQTHTLISYQNSYCQLIRFHLSTASYRSSPEPSSFHVTCH